MFTCGQKAQAPLIKAMFVKKNSPKRVDKAGDVETKTGEFLDATF